MCWGVPRLGLKTGCGRNQLESCAPLRRMLQTLRKSRSTRISSMITAEAGRNRGQFKISVALHGLFQTVQQHFYARRCHVLICEQSRTTLG